MLSHLPWVQKISEVLLRDVNVSVEDYIDSVTTPGVPVDFVGLMVLCRAYHFHIAVFTTRGIWSTARRSKKRKNKNCLFGLVYHGSFVFSETVKAGTSEEYMNYLEQRRIAGKLPSHDRNAMPGTLKISTVPQVLNDANNNVLCKHAADTTVPEPSAPVQGSHICKVKEEDDFSPDSTAQDEIEAMGPADSTTKNEVGVASVKSEAGGATKSETLLSSDDSQDSLEVLKCDSTMPYSDGEDSTITVLWQSASDSMRVAESAAGVASDDNEDQEDEEGDEDTGDLLLTCPMCLKRETMQKACLAHISSFHPEYRFKCSYCGKQFAVYNTKYTHERQHFGPKHYCGECGKGFFFRSELLKHLPVHSNVLPYPCDQCPKCFSQKKSLKRHKRLHDDDTHACEHCDKVCETPERLYTHVRGKHGKGYDAKCGKNFPWSASKHRHQDRCTKCQSIIEAETAEKNRTTSINEATPSPAKKIKKDIDENIQETKDHIAFKIENIMHMKQDM